MTRPSFLLAPAGRRHRRLAGAAAFLTALVWVAAACGGSTGGGDPGNRRLHELGRERVFAARPPRATDVSVTRTRAYYVKPGFSGGGWHGPSVVVRFTSAAPAAEVFRFYAREARASGWRATKTNVLHLPNTWTKKLPDGAPGTLLLLEVSPPGARPGRYMLTGSVPTVG